MKVKSAEKSELDSDPAHIIPVAGRTTHVSLPAVSSLGAFRTPDIGPRATIRLGRHLKTFTLADPRTRPPCIIISNGTLSLLLHGRETAAGRFRASFFRLLFVTIIGGGAVPASMRIHAIRATDWRSSGLRSDGAR